MDHENHGSIAPGRGMDRCNGRSRDFISRECFKGQNAVFGNCHGKFGIVDKMIEKYVSKKATDVAFFLLPDATEDFVKGR